VPPTIVPDAAPVLLWRPEVHSYYNETLYYFLIAVNGDTDVLIAELDGRLAKIGVTGICLYEIFGQYDVLLRVWLTPNLEALLLDELEQLRENKSISNFHPFRVSQLYHWAYDQPDVPADERPITSGPLRVLLTEKKEVRPDVVRQAQTGKMDLIDSLKAEGALLYYGPIFDARQIKFYAAIHHPTPVAATISDMLSKSILEMLKQSGNGIHKYSLYVGDGFAWGLVKGLAPDSYSVRDLLMVIRKIVLPFDMRTTTYMVSVRTPIESDNVNHPSLATIEEAEPKQWLKSWLPELYSNTKLPSARTKELEFHLINKYKDGISSILGSQEGDLVSGFVSGILHEEPRECVANLAVWFAGVEGPLHEGWWGFLRTLARTSSQQVDDITKLHVELVIEAMPKTDEDEDEQEAGTDGGRRVSSKKKVRDSDITLYPRLRMYYAALKYFDCVPPSLGELEQPDAFFNTVAALRNDVMHGRLFAQVVVRWQDVLDILLKFFPVVDELNRLTKGSTGIGE
jgi:hypothetical protein